MILWSRERKFTVLPTLPGTELALTIFILTLTMKIMNVSEMCCCSNYKTIQKTLNFTEEDG